MISIIIPTRNESHVIIDTLCHLQTLRKNNICEVILVDGSSSDDTVDIAKRYVNHILIVEPSRSRQQNIGASIAKGDILLFLHADTFISNEQLIELNKMSLKVKWGFFKLMFTNQKIKYRILSYFINARSMIRNYATGDQAIFVNKELFNKIKGFPKLMLMEDLGFCSILKNYYPPLIVDSKVITSSRRWEQNGFIGTIVKMRILRFLYSLGVNTKFLEKNY